MKRRVVITGMGCVTPFGTGVENTWNALINGKSGIRKLSLDTDKHLVKIGGEVPDFSVDEYVDPKEAKRLDKFILFPLIASIEAAKDGNFDMSKENPYRVGVIIGSAQGGLYTMTQSRDLRLSCYHFDKL